MFASDQQSPNALCECQKKKLFEQMKRMYSHDENLNESSCIDLVTTRKQQRQNKHLFEDQPLTS
jgi:hypothetical protein